MDLASTDGKNIGWATLKLSQSLVLQWLAVFRNRARLTVFVDSDMAGILAS